MSDLKLTIGQKWGQAYKREDTVCGRMQAKYNVGILLDQFSIVAIFTQASGINWVHDLRPVMHDTGYVRWPCQGHVRDGLFVAPPPGAQREVSVPFVPSWEMNEIYNYESQNMDNSA